MKRLTWWLVYIFAVGLQECVHCLLTIFTCTQCDKKGFGWGTNSIRSCASKFCFFYTIIKLLWTGCDWFVSFKPHSWHIVKENILKEIWCLLFHFACIILLECFSFCKFLQKRERNFIWETERLPDDNCSVAEYKIKCCT